MTAPVTGGRHVSGRRLSTSTPTISVLLVPSVILAAGRRLFWQMTSLGVGALYLGGRAARAPR